MENIVDCELYHIHTLFDKSNIPNKYSKKWKVGNKLNFECDGLSQNNLRSERILNPYMNLNWEKTLIKRLTLEKISENNLKSYRYFQIEFYQKGLLNKYFQLANELILEEVRKETFPDKPSRLNCFWLTDKQNLKKWLKQIPKNEFPQKIFLVKFTGKIHKGDAKLISKCTYSFNELYKDAVSYWKGVPKHCEENTFIEYVCCGSLTIIEELNTRKINFL